MGFLLLRFSNIYGDPAPWNIQDKGLVYSMMSFLSTTKYPPSLVYLLMTLVPALLLLSIFDNWGMTTVVKTYRKRAYHLRTGSFVLLCNTISIDSHYRNNKILCCLWAGGMIGFMRVQVYGLWITTRTWCLSIVSGFSLF